MDVVRRPEPSYLIHQRQDSSSLEPMRCAPKRDYGLAFAPALRFPRLFAECAALLALVARCLILRGSAPRMAARISASASSVTGHRLAAASVDHMKSAVSHDDMRRASRAPPRTR